MTSQEVMVQIGEPEELLEENYTLLPYVKLSENENLMILDGQIYEEHESDDRVFCVPVTDSLFDCTITDTDTVEEQVVTEGFLNEHQYTVSNDDVDLSNITLHWTNELQTKTNSLKCSLCQKLMKSPVAFIRHLRTHTGEKPYQCEICSKRFSQQSNLWKHVLIHTGERRFECTECNKKFSQRANLQKHMMVHTGEKPFECYICSKTFTQRANLNKHIRIHTGEKPFVCKYCNRQFAQQANMQKHELLHEGVKPFMCSICSSTFTQQSNLKKHIETHSSGRNSKPKLNYVYKCVHCIKVFSNTSQLYAHMDMCTNKFGRLTYIDNSDKGFEALSANEKYGIKIEIQTEEEAVDS